jgi:hypothetical protein
MQRRRALQIGAAFAALPLTGCGAPAPGPALAPVAAKDPPAKPEVIVPDPVKTAAPAPVAAAPVEPAAVKDPAPAPKYTFSRVIGKIGKNHRHVLVVPFEDVKAGAEKSYDISGASGHQHTVTLSPEQMKGLLAGQDVRTKSSLDHQHAHRILVKCAPAVDPPEWVNAVTVEFSGKDEHELVVTAADLAAKVDRTYDVQGIAGHAHTVTIPAAEFEKLVKSGNTKMFTSRAEDGHDHLAVIYNRPPKA